MADIGTYPATISEGMYFTTRSIYGSPPAPATADAMLLGSGDGFTKRPMHSSVLEKPQLQLCEPGRMVKDIAHPTGVGPLSLAGDQHTDERQLITSGKILDNPCAGIP